MDERVPSPDDLRAIAECVQFIVSMSGHLAPPGYARAEAAGEAWPTLLDAELMAALQVAEDIFASAPCYPESLGLVVEGWPLEVEFALYQARSAVRGLAERWEAAAGAGDDETPMPRLAVDEGLHAELRWAHTILAEAAQDEATAEHPGLGRAVFAKLAEELRADKLDGPAALVELLAKRSSAPIDDEYYRAVHGGRVSHTAVRQNASKATGEARSRGVPVRYRALSREVRRVASQLT